ncbi:MAG TPA: hypothetical protein VG245_03435, partial [Candidatus Dormibacteraeota bacterium]|nr:hypothetical protein [Candidatus Dormibacteraeota bacterium]
FASPGTLAAAYRETLLERLGAAGWTPAELTDATAALDARPTSAPPPGLTALHRDLTGLRRAHPGATW